VRWLATAFENALKPKAATSCRSQGSKFLFSLNRGEAVTKAPRKLPPEDSRPPWERRRPGGQAYQKPHSYYLLRIALIETPIFGRLLPARRRRSQGGLVSDLIERRRSSGKSFPDIASLGAAIQRPVQPGCEGSAAIHGRLPGVLSGEATVLSIFFLFLRMEMLINGDWLLFRKHVTREIMESFEVGPGMLSISIRQSKNLYWRTIPWKSD